MIYSQVPVHAALRPYIRSYHLMELNNLQNQHQMVPASSKCMLNIPYGDSIQLRLKGDTYTSSRPFFLGLATQSYSFSVAGSKLKCFLIEFTDIGFHSLFREDSQAFVDQPVALEDLDIFHQLEPLQALLAEAKTPAERVAFTERFLLQLLPSSRQLNRMDRAEAAIQLIRQHKGMFNMTLLADEVCLSEGQLRRLFAEVKGCSPKHFARLIRFTNIFTEVMQQPGRINWTELAHRYHYYDQMHFIKDFKQYTLYTPSRFPLRQFSFSSAFSFKLPESEDNKGWKMDSGKNI